VQPQIPDPPPSSPATDQAVTRWCEADRARAFLKSDHEVIDSTTAVRSVIVERLLHDRAVVPASRAGALVASELVGVDRDLLHAFGILGGLVGERGGSPTLAAAVVDGALEALAAGGSLSEAARGAAWVLPARAALAEAFSRAQLEGVRAQASLRWEYPGCAVGVAEGTVAIAAGYPDDDADALQAWASRVAHAAAMAGVRRVVVSGSKAGEAALAEALEIAGITRLPGQTPPTRPLPWRR
jgi:hypothetical protein